jgi:hypothetical protein
LGQPESGDQDGEDFVRTFKRSTFSPPGGTRFSGAPLPVFQAAPEAGLPAQGQGEPGSVLEDKDKSRLTASFRNAYIEGLFRGIPLTGILGGDRVHRWPPAAPVTLVQNWRTAASRPNSWGIPSLILAAEDPDSRRVFIIRGAILDAYGKSAGLRGANGAAGYGSPRGEDFFYQGDMAQRFDYGLITVDAAGTARFIPGEAPAAEVPEETGAFSDPAVTEAFRSAWKAGTAQYLPPLEADTPVNHIDFSARSWILSGGPDVVSGEILASFPVRGIYYQTFGGGRMLFILTDAPDLPFYPRILTSPFLDALLTVPAGDLPGAEDLIPDPLPAEYDAERNSFTRALLAGISLYGVPLSGAQAVEDEKNGGWCEAQRFSRGWMIADEGQE